MKVFEEKKGNIFKILSEAISEGIVIVNEKQEIVTSNEAADSMFGYEAKELLGKSINLLIPTEYRHSHTEQVGGYLEKSDPRPGRVRSGLYQHVGAPLFETIHRYPGLAACRSSRSIRYP